jgi:hypothetical protein
VIEHLMPLQEKERSLFVWEINLRDTAFSSYLF